MFDDWVIKCFVNKPIPSNTFVVYDRNTKYGLVVDPGTEDCDELLRFCFIEGIILEYIILTHEHLDHVWGTNRIKNTFGAKIVCSELCANKIAKPQNIYNLLYYNTDTMFCVPEVDVLLEEIDYKLKWNQLQLFFFKTLGHSDCSVCFSINNSLFTGDTVMKGYKPYIKSRHGGTISDFRKSINLIFDSFSQSDTIVYPGHGDMFVLKEVYDQYQDFFANK